MIFYAVSLLPAYYSHCYIQYKTTEIEPTNVRARLDNTKKFVPFPRMYYFASR